MPHPIEIPLKPSKSLRLLFCIYCLGVVLLLVYLFVQEEFQASVLVVLGVFLVIGIVLSGRRIGLFQRIYQNQPRLRISQWKQDWQLHIAHNSSKAWEKCTILCKGFVCGYGYLEFLYNGRKHIHYSTGKELPEHRWRQYKAWLIWGRLEGISRIKMSLKQ